RHRLGDDPTQDELLIAMTDAKDWCSVYEPEEAEVTVFETGDFYSNTIRIRPLGSSAPPGTIYTSKEFRAGADFRKDRIYFVTNDVVYATLSNFTAPGRLYQIDGKSLAWSLLWEDKPPLDTSRIESKLVFYPSKDGTRIPMFLSYRKGMALDGSNPVFLHGYGG